jgi:endonuclease/exonuclease/phosphatase family metal-dependent hydrolase
VRRLLRPDPSGRPGRLRDRPVSLVTETGPRHGARDAVDLRIVTYNVHRGRGLDRRTRPERIAALLATIDPDIAALQEVIGPGLSGPGHAEMLGAALGMGWVMAPTRELRRHQFGNVILSRYPIREHAQHDLSWKTCEPRCSQRVAVELGHGRTLHVYNAHLGTALLERRYQAVRLAAWVHARQTPGPKLLLGDFNEWSRGLAADVLAQRLQSIDLYPHLRRRRTYPGFFPVLHLDHIYFEGEVEVRRVELPRSRLALVASDHLPLVADVRLRF